MLESLRNLKTSEIRLRQQLPVLEGEWLVGCLLAKQGVANVSWLDGTRRLSVQYDADLFGTTEIVAFLLYCGVAVVGVRGLV